ncbi:MAG: resolvase [Oligoflexia bacterium]|nr:MAG: resolvase [Oligoflexia bacterium]
MNQVKAVAYARVSTLLKQEPEHQLVPIRGVATNREFQLVGEYVDRITGSADRRKALDQLVKDARMGKFKVVIIFALDRLARDTRFLLNLLHELDGYGVTLISLRESIDLGTPVGRAVTQILGAIAELEKSLISERIKTALAVKKMTAADTGWSCGRKPLPDETVEQVKTLRANGKSIREISRTLEIGKTSVERILKGRR